MADLTIGTVKTGSDVTETDFQLVELGESVTAGQAVYEKASDNLYWLADADASDTADAAGVAIVAGDANDKVHIQKGNSIDLGATLTVGETYVVSTTAGGIAPISDLGSGDFTKILGIATDANNLKLDLGTVGPAKA